MQSNLKSTIIIMITTTMDEIESKYTNFFNIISLDGKVN